MIKIDIISGFLGAGKTTLIKKLFKSSLKNEKVCLIENEFGEIGIDGSFLKESGVNIKEINSGCICCSLVGDFATSMKEVISTYQPERIIIEPSGVGKLSDILKAINTVEEDLQVNIVACVVDGKKAKMQIKNFGEFLKDQIQSAKTIIVSKVDMIDEHKLQETVDLIHTISPSANVVTTSLEEIEDQQILDILEANVSLKDMMIEEVKHHHPHHDEECCCGHHHHHEEAWCCHEHHEHHHHHEHHEECCCQKHQEECHHEHHHEECCCHHHEHHHHEEGCCHHEHHDHHHHHADEVFTSWGIETAYSITKENLEKFLDELSSGESYGIILRSKGILKAKEQDKWHYFDYVAGDYSIREGRPDYTGRIVVIGSNLDVEKIQTRFNELVK